MVAFLSFVGPVLLFGIMIAIVWVIDRPATSVEEELSAGGRNA